MFYIYMCSINKNVHMNIYIYKYNIEIYIDILCI